MTNYIEDWDDDGAYEEEYDIIETKVLKDLKLVTVDFNYQSHTAIWTVLEEVASYFELHDITSPDIYHIFNESFEGGECCLTLIYHE